MARSHALTVAVEVHVRVDGAMSVCRSHELTEDIERRLRARSAKAR